MMRIASLLLLAGLYIPAAYGQEDFYIADGKNVPLTPSDTYRAFQIVEDKLDSFIKVWSNNPIVAVERFSVSERDEYRIVMVKRRQVQDPQPRDDEFDQEVDKQLSSGLIKPLVEREVPAFSLGGVELLLVNRFLIRFQPGTDEGTAGLFISSRLDATILEQDKARGRYTIAFPQNTPLMEALSKINQSNEDPLVWYAEPLFIRTYPPRQTPPEIKTGSDSHKTKIYGSSAAGGGIACDPPIPAASPPEDVYFDNQWALKNTGNNPLPGYAGSDINWIATSGGSEITIAVIDLGVELDHPDLLNNIGPGVDMTGSGDASNKFDHDYHGTAVAGLAAAVTNNSLGIAGVAPLAKIASVRVGESTCGNCSWQTANGWEPDAIRKSVQLGARVLINAWNAQGAGAPSTDFTQAIEEAVSAGALIVFSAGNHTPQVVSGVPTVDPAVTWPATHASTVGSHAVQHASISVSATNHKDQLKTSILGKTNCGSGPSAPVVGTTNVGSNHGREVDLAAPGVKVCSTNTNHSYSYFGDTSAAAAITGGAAAVLFSLHPTAEPSEVKTWLEDAARDLCPDGVDEFTGHGRIDLAKAIDLAQITLRLEVEDAGKRIKKGKSRWVKATASRQGMPVVGLPVSFTVTSGLGLDPIAAVNTDAQGVAEVNIKGLKKFYSKEKIKAEADDGKDTQVVTVPNLPVWGTWLFMMLALSGVGRRKRFRDE
jgi:subtilisin family serine protease